MESFFAILIIDAHEGRYVTIFDVPVTYVNADTQEAKFVLLNIEGEFMDIMCEVKTKHNTYIHV